MLVQLQGREVWYLQLNEAVSRRLVELMQERGMTQYQLYMKSGVPKSTIGNLVNCAYYATKIILFEFASRCFPSHALPHGKSNPQ